MKRWVAILFLSFFALNFAGIYVYFALRLIHIRQEMRAALKAMPSERLTKLEMTEAEFRQSRVEDHEIKVAGKMYDIARMEAENGNIIVWCLHDEAEDTLLGFLDAVTNRAHHDRQTLPPSVVEFLTLTYLISSFEFSLGQPTGKPHLVTQPNFYLPPYRYISNPPPEA